MSQFSFQSKEWSMCVVDQREEVEQGLNLMEHLCGYCNENSKPEMLRKTILNLYKNKEISAYKKKKFMGIYSNWNMAIHKNAL